MIPAVDWHIHTTLSPDGQATVEEYCEKAVELGLSGVGFSEHFEPNPADPAFQYGYEACREAISRARAKHAGRLEVFFGIEIGYEEAREPSIRKFLEAHDFDYRIGSVHEADGINYSVTKAGLTALPGVNGKARYAPYFRELLHAVRSGLFDILGHIDVIKRFDPRDEHQFDPASFDSEIREILAEVIRRGIVLEVNTSGFRQPFKESFPGDAILSLYRKLGGRKVSLGSDSHKLRHLATLFSETLSRLQNLGFGDDCFFRIYSTR
jgi:histidinol-phosphatase (PHP family)